MAKYNDKSWSIVAKYIGNSHIWIIQYR